MVMFFIQKDTLLKFFLSFVFKVSLFEKFTYETPHSVRKVTVYSSFKCMDFLLKAK